MAKNRLTAIIVGIGGYGGNYVDVLLHHQDEVPADFIGAIAPHPEKCYYYQELLDKHIPIYHSIEEFFEAREKECPGLYPLVDLAILSTPIYLHKSGIIDCVNRGIHVLCEKPICATIDEVREIIAARDKNNVPVHIGYQWSHDKNNLALKKDILDGKYGKLKSMRTIVLWPRDFAYYGRGSGWAGKLRMGENWTLDSVASNATAHYLHNMFFLNGPAMDQSAQVKEIEVETYRANDIETYDTVALRGKLENGADFTFFASHALDKDMRHGPFFEFEFENGKLVYNDGPEIGEMKGYFADGTVKDYGGPAGSVLEKTIIAANTAMGHGSVVCTPEAASVHTRVVNAITENIPETPVFPEDVTVRNEERVWIKGLYEILCQCYDEGKLPSELGASWARKAVKIDLSSYDHFGLLDK